MNKGKLNIQAKFQQFAGAMMIPIIVLVVCGLTMGIASPLANFIFTKGTVLWKVARLFMKIASLIIRNLSLWFVIGVTFGLSKKNKGYAALAGIFMLMSVNTVISNLASFDGITQATLNVEWLMENMAMSADKAIVYTKMYTNVLGIFTYDLSIFGAIISGIVVAWMMNKWGDTKLPNALAFFAGPKFIIMLVPVFAVGLGFVLYHVWPVISAGIQTLAIFIGNAGLFGTFVYGCVDRALLPFGMHHLVTMPLRYTELGGTMLVDGVMVSGTKNIEIALTGSPTATHYLIRNFTSGRLLINLGGWPGAAFAMYVTAKKENRKKMLALIIPAVFTATFVGVTEPIEFTTLFASPLLYYLVHVPLSGLAFVLAEATKVSIQGFAVIFMLPNILQPAKVQALSLLYLVPIYFALYFIVFRWAILKFNLKTPGRGDSDVKFVTKKEYRNSRENGPKDGIVAFHDAVIEAFGGRNNIVSVENCATRLRVTVKDDAVVAEQNAWLDDLEALGYVKNGLNYQIIYGPKVTNISADIKEALDIN
ncbi:PTS mannose transporter subunit IIC [Acidaminobacter sp. JC074]|uniref:PTS transporter subunit EIIC n=1 Tax=Acidaminobacter sp. JC074 TaxID=2530199 RepID=UPI001F0F1E56|nr:PTS transporter subunit EIIC [Acidaminobacter sp. JC074]MCH4886158.1 PTS mannose transporter subunit IIC [Acidaminobacter sp. JC074]